MGRLWTSTPCGSWRTGRARDHGLLLRTSHSSAMSCLTNSMPFHGWSYRQASGTLPASRSQGRLSARSFAALCSLPGRRRWAKGLEDPSSMSASRRTWRLASCARIFTTAIRRVYIAASSAHLRSFPCLKPVRFATSTVVSWPVLSGGSFASGSGGSPNQPTRESCAGPWATRACELLFSDKTVEEFSILVRAVAGLVVASGGLLLIGFERS